jgi:hypothetical protein
MFVAKDIHTHPPLRRSGIFKNISPCSGPAICFYHCFLPRRGIMFIAKTHTHTNPNPEGVTENTMANYH